MDTYGDNYGERFAVTALDKYFEETIVDKITNRNYERYITEGGASLVHVKTFGSLTLGTYTGADMTAEDPSESEGDFNPDQQRFYYFTIKSLTKFEDYVKDPESDLIKQAVAQLKEAVDAYVLGLYADAGAGNRVGVDYTTGTITITITTGACTGSGTAWTSGMSGLGIKATGHSKWYRFTYASGTTGFVYNDSDDDTASYDGGTITGAAYTIEAAAVKTVTVDNIFESLDGMAVRLSEHKIPKADRWTVVNARIASVLRRSDELTQPLQSSYDDVVKRGLIGQAAGFTVYENEQVSGNSVTGWYCMAGHTSAITFAMEMQQSGIEQDIIGNFGKRFKALWVYGGKVLDERRKGLAYMWVKV